MNDIVVLLLAAYGWYSLGRWAMVVAQSIIAYDKLEEPYNPRLFDAGADPLDGLFAIAKHVGLFLLGPAVWLWAIWAYIFSRLPRRTKHRGGGTRSILPPLV